MTTSQQRNLKTHFPSPRSRFRLGEIITSQNQSSDTLDPYSPLQDLIAADKSGTSDPFAKITFETHTKQTRVVKKTLYPVFNETFQYDISRASSVISIQVFDYDFFGQNDFLGQVEIPVASITIEAVHDGWFSLEPRDGFSDVVSGQIHLVISITPKVQVCASFSMSTIRDHPFLFQLKLCALGGC